MGDPEKTAFYVCRDFACLQPVYTVEEFIKEIETAATGGIKEPV
jgi:hypothetical protein